ncbi:MAG: inositol monophosphatase family protein [Planctomycetota bacterium]
MTEDRELTDAAIRFAKAGGDVVMRHFGTDVQMDTKGVGNLVSEADLESERTILGLIRSQFPHHAVIAEESASGSHATEGDVWIIDPLDGTNNFAHVIPHFAVSVAFYRNGQPRCGVVLNPANEDLYVATRHQGATWNGSPIHVAAADALTDALVATGFYYDRGDMMRQTLKSMEQLFLRGVHGLRRFGTASLDLCQVAQGRFSAYFEYQLAPWDFAAGRLIVEEAGGAVTDCLGAELEVKTSSVLASNGPLHAEMLRCI